MSIRICEAQLESITPYIQSGFHETEKLPKEKPDEYEIRTWRNKATTDKNGVVCIPSMALKMCVDESIKRLQLQIPGKGKTQYTKYFLAGQLCDADVSLGIHKDAAIQHKVWANADGVRGSGKRVKRFFPMIESWNGAASFQLLDDNIPNDIFERALREAGLLVGIGSFRPERGGLHGRFTVKRISWSEMKI